MEGESVQLYTYTISKFLTVHFKKIPTELKPRPNLPVVEPSLNFKESPRLERLWKSSSLKIALLYARSAGPWYCSSLVSRSSPTGWVLSSSTNRYDFKSVHGQTRSCKAHTTSVAPASSAFCKSSRSTPPPAG